MIASQIGIFDILKIGIGPSSSHTLGPWRAALRWIDEAKAAGLAGRIDRVEVHLYGSLALTGKGHATDTAVTLGLTGADPRSFDVERVLPTVDDLRHTRRLRLPLSPEGWFVAFDPDASVVFHRSEQLSGHPNGMAIHATLDGARCDRRVYYSVGGGFIQSEAEGTAAEPGGQETPEARPVQPLPYTNAAELLDQCRAVGTSIAGVVRANERVYRSDAEIDRETLELWRAMRNSAWKGCHKDGVLPGGLGVVRRAPALHGELQGADRDEGPDEWFKRLRRREFSVSRALRWISCFALAVNEENAALGRVVTAPTNGAAGVIPAVLIQHLVFADAHVAPHRTTTPVKPSADRRRATEDRAIVDFLLTAAAVGALFKSGATISAAMGGCQAEIGVSCAMAAAALTAVRGGSPEQSLMAAEIAMEHHLGLTCDPVGGLVQVPCIERNTMGAVKAINAAELALVSDPANARVSLDQVIATMRQTAADMSSNYKETSLGGLAVHIPVNVIEC